MPVRVLKVLLFLAFTLWISLTAINNVIDYQSNWGFVKHILSMDDILKESSLKYRAVVDVTWQHAIYNTIIVWECLTALVCWFGFWRLLRGLAQFDYQPYKTMAITGLSMILFLYAYGFMAFASGWFLMWQSKWSAQNTAMGMFCSVGVTLIWLSLRED